MLIRMGDMIRRALDQTFHNMKQRQDGLIVPPDYIRGRHFGGFHGYEPWIQDCIRTACASVRGVGPDELSEITAVVSWVSQQEILCYFGKHAEAIESVRRFASAIGDTTGKHDGLSQEAELQYSRTQGSRERGTLLVIAMNFTEAEKTGVLKTSVSAWNPASVEEAQAVPAQKYLLG